MATFAIGDIHGEFDCLERLINRVDPQPGDVVVQLGDCVNRGPRSFEVVEFWINFDRCDRFVLGGNHEEMFYDYIEEGSEDLLQYGGGATIESYRARGWRCERGDPASIPPDHYQFYVQAYPWTRTLISTSRYLFVHAGYDFSLPRETQNQYSLKWGRVQGWRPGMQTVIRGHTPHRRVVMGRAAIEVDTGCGLGGGLSCIRLPDGKVWSESP
jgi:serine/threonine protein phosphatase 1